MLAPAGFALQRFRKEVEISLLSHVLALAKLDAVSRLYARPTHKVADKITGSGNLDPDNCFIIRIEARLPVEDAEVL